VTPFDDHQPGERVTIAQICNLTAWMRRLTDSGIGQADPADLAAFGRAKADLLARIQHTWTPNALSDQAGDPRD
jgi:hypothetical protein